MELNFLCLQPAKCWVRGEDLSTENEDVMICCVVSCMGLWQNGDWQETTDEAQGEGTLIVCMFLN